MAESDKERIFAQTPEEPRSNKETLESTITSALVNYRPIELQEIIISALTDSKLTPNPKHFAKHTADLMQLMTGKEADPTGRHDGPASVALRKIYDVLVSFQKKAGWGSGKREELLEAVRNLDLRY